MARLGTVTKTPETGDAEWVERSIEEVSDTVSKQTNQNEVSQKDKDHYNILTHIYGIYKDFNDNHICRTEKKKTQIYRPVL